MVEGYSEAAMLSRMYFLTFLMLTTGINMLKKEIEIVKNAPDR
jgi:hypothetical protein